MEYCFVLDVGESLHCLVILIINRNEAHRSLLLLCLSKHRLLREQSLYSDDRVRLSLIHCINYDSFMVELTLIALITISLFIFICFMKYR